MTTIHCDIETRSSADIKATGLYRYAQDEDFDILLFAYSVDESPVKLIDLKSGEKLPQEIIDALEDPSAIKHAHNAAFEWYCLNRYGIKTPLASWRCDMIHALYCGYPGSLGELCKALGVPEDKQKMSVGKALIRHFCVPRKPTKANKKKYNDPWDSPEKWELFKEYNIRDVETEMENERRLSSYPVPDSEWHLWHLDVAMNARGVRIDTDLVKGALIINDRSTEELTKEAIAITGLDNPNSQVQLVGWLNSRGVEATSIAKEALADMLASDVPRDVREMLEIRKKLGLSSIKKYVTAETAVCEDGYMRGISQFYGANRTGRYAGRILQAQNLTKNHIDTLDFARELVKAGDYDSVKFFYGNVPDLLSQLIRTMFIPSEGRHLVVADFASIEARIVAWLSGCQWRLDLFKNGGDIYCASASQMFGVPVVKNGVNGHLRQKGKVAELALGYGGSSGAMIAMGALEQGLTEEELPEIVDLWRKASPEIVKLWRDLDKAIEKVMSTAKEVTVGCLKFRLEGDMKYGQCFFTMELPTGRKLYYPRPHMSPNRFGNDSLHYSGIDIKKKWGVLDTYGPKLLENATQAIARDCLTEILLRIEKKGWDVVFHVHDEIIADCSPDVTEEDLCELMAEPIPWAPGLLLTGAGFTEKYYKKD